MSKLIRGAKSKLVRMESGQVLVVVALSIVILIAIVGLAMDVGVMFIENARLRRAVDAAALAAALQYREGFVMPELDNSATEFLRLNGINDAEAIVQICGGPEGHSAADLCTTPARKLVRVRARGTVHLAFLSVVGIDTAPISAEAISETASVDVVLLIDVSESMSLDGAEIDPTICNKDSITLDMDAKTPGGVYYEGTCQPLLDVKRAAVQFVKQLYFPYDQVAVITFAKSATRILPLNADFNYIIDQIAGLQVYEGEGICPTGDPCRRYDSDGKYVRFDCGSWKNPGDDPSRCPTTNIGGGLLEAGNLFGSNPRKAALWATILLTDGATNSGVCPESTWWPPPFCRRNPIPYEYVRENSTSPNYDAQDYARDMADFLAVGQKSLIFAIGLGQQATLPAAVGLLEYVVSDDVGMGLYYPSPTPAQLRDIFMKIANNIATRIAK
jgi:hypothetical protein